MKFLLFLFLLLQFPGGLNSKEELNIDAAIEKTTTYLLKNWRSDNKLKQWQAPQVIPVKKGSKIYGGCTYSEYSIDVAGSYYCPSTHTIILVPSQLKSFRKIFGNSSIAYIISHEYAHAIQLALKFNLPNPYSELQADCLAGYLINKGNIELGITRENILEMASAAYSIGGKTHGTGAQRSYALLSGMGTVDSDCSAESITKLGNDEIYDPFYKRITRERSDGSGLDINSSTYRKDAFELLGISKENKI